MPGPRNPGPMTAHAMGNEPPEAADPTRWTETQLSSARFDQPPFPGRPHVPFLICSTRRTGSYLLCRLLIQAGIGVPHEYLNPIHIFALCDRWRIQPRDSSAYIGELFRRRTTANGAWGAKVQWPQLARHRAAVEQVLTPAARFIHLHRSDSAAQAVSLHIAYRTGSWGTDGRSTTPAIKVDAGDPFHLRRCLSEIQEQEAAWHQWLSDQGRPVLDLSYETLAADQPGSVAAIAAFLGMPHGSWTPPRAEPRPPQHGPPADARATWRDLLFARP